MWAYNDVIYAINRDLQYKGQTANLFGSGLLSSTQRFKQPLFSGNVPANLVAKNLGYSGKGSFPIAQDVELFMNYLNYVANEHGWTTYDSGNQLIGPSGFRWYRYSNKKEEFTPQSGRPFQLTGYPIDNIEFWRHYANVLKFVAERSAYRYILSSGISSSTIDFAVQGMPSVVSTLNAPSQSELTWASFERNTDNTVPILFNTSNYPYLTMHVDGSGDAVWNASSAPAAFNLPSVRGIYHTQNLHSSGLISQYKMARGQYDPFIFINEIDVTSTTSYPASGQQFHESRPGNLELLGQDATRFNRPFITQGFWVSHWRRANKQGTFNGTKTYTNTFYSGYILSELNNCIQSGFQSYVSGHYSSPLSVGTTENTVWPIHTYSNSKVEVNIALGNLSGLPGSTYTYVPGMYDTIVETYNVEFKSQFNYCFCPLSSKFHTAPSPNWLKESPIIFTKSQSVGDQILLDKLNRGVPEERLIARPLRSYWGVDASGLSNLYSLQDRAYKSDLNSFTDKSVLDVRAVPNYVSASINLNAWYNHYYSNNIKYGNRAIQLVYGYVYSSGYFGETALRGLDMEIGNQITSGNYTVLSTLTTNAGQLIGSGYYYGTIGQITYPLSGTPVYQNHPWQVTVDVVPPRDASLIYFAVIPESGGFVTLPDLSFTQFTSGPNYTFQVVHSGVPTSSGTLTKLYPQTYLVYNNSSTVNSQYPFRYFHQGYEQTINTPETFGSIGRFATSGVYPPSGNYTWDFSQLPSGTIRSFTEQGSVLVPQTIPQIDFQGKLGPFVLGIDRKILDDLDAYEPWMNQRTGKYIPTGRITTRL